MPQATPISEFPLERPGIFGPLGDYFKADDLQMGRLYDFVADTAEIESTSGKFTKNPKSTASGIFHFLRQKKGQTSTQTAANKLRHSYDVLVGEAPEFIDELDKHGDSNLLTPGQQEELLIGNIWQNDGTDPLIRRIMDGDAEAAIDVYINYHLQDSGSPDKDARKRAKDIYRRRSGMMGGGLIRDVYGRTLI